MIRKFLLTVLSISIFCMIFPSISSAQTAGKCLVKTSNYATFSTQEKFIKTAVSPARQSQKITAVPASVTIAQAILESGWGEFNLGVHNYFGIKAQKTTFLTQDNKTLKSAARALYDWGDVAKGCTIKKSLEYVTKLKRDKKTKKLKEVDVPVYYYSAFRAYKNMKASFVDHGRFLTDNIRYQPAFKYCLNKKLNYKCNPYKFAIEVHRAGYATSPTYSEVLVNLIKKHKLYKYDLGYKS